MISRFSKDGKIGFRKNYIKIMFFTVLAVLVVLLNYFTLIKKSNDDVSNKKVLKAGIFPQYAPIAFISIEGSPNGKLTFNNKQNASGHDIYIYIIEEIAKKMGYDEVQLHAVDFSALIPSINNGTFDVAITAMGLTPERQEIATPSIPYLYPDMGMLVRSDDPRFSDIPNKSTLDNLDRLAVDDNNQFYTKPIKIHTIGGTVYQSHILPSIKDHLYQQRFNNEPHYQAHPMESSDGPQDSFTLAQV